MCVRAGGGNRQGQQLTAQCLQPSTLQQAWPGAQATALPQPAQPTCRKVSSKYSCCPGESTNASMRVSSLSRTLLRTCMIRGCRGVAAVSNMKGLVLHHASNAAHGFCR